MAPKLSRPWIGPARVIVTKPGLPGLVVEFASSTGVRKSHFKIHVERAKPYHLASGPHAEPDPFKHPRLHSQWKAKQLAYSGGIKGEDVWREDLQNETQENDQRRKKKTYPKHSMRLRRRLGLPEEVDPEEADLDEFDKVSVLSTDSDDPTSESEVDDEYPAVPVTAPMYGHSDAKYSAEEAEEHPDDKSASEETEATGPVTSSSSHSEKHQEGITHQFENNEKITGEQTIDFESGKNQLALRKTGSTHAHNLNIPHTTTSASAPASSQNQEEIPLLHLPEEIQSAKRNRLNELEPQRVAPRRRQRPLPADTAEETPQSALQGECTARDFPSPATQKKPLFKRLIRIWRRRKV